ncbi:MAG: sugar kinase [Pseudomonadota bacterium]
MGTEIITFGEAMVELSAIQDDQCRIGIGGDTFNTAVYLARNGHHVAYATAVGTCPFSAQLLDALHKENISKHLAPALPGRSVGLYAISVDDEGERSFTYWRSESAVRSLFDAPEANEVLSAMREVETLYLSGITLSLYTDEVQGQILNLMEERKSAGNRNVFDGNYRPRNWKNVEAARSVIMKAIGLATWSLPTFDDEAELFGDRTPEETAERHRATGADEVVVKHGADGALVDGVEWVKPPEKVTPKDTTGAGDSFNAAFLSARLRGASSVEAALAGHKLAARVLSVPGALIPA